MSDIRKWLKIMESVPPVIATAPEAIGQGFKRDATVVINPRAGGGVGRFMNYTNEGAAMIDIKGVAREFSKDDYSVPERDLENGNDWFHMSTEPDTQGRMNDSPEFRPGDMVKIADVYGAVIGPGFGVFVGYGTTGEDCIVLFDGKQIVVPVENVASVLEQDAKDNFDDMDNDGNLSPMSFGSDNVKIEQPQNSGMQSREPAMDTRDEFSKWMSAVEEALSSEGKELAEDIPSQTSECGCGSWDCPACFPSQDEMPGMHGALDGIGGAHPEDTVVFGTINMNPAMPVPPNMPQPPCSVCSGNHQAHDHAMDTELQRDMNDIAFDQMELEEVGMFDEDDAAVSDFLAKGGEVQQLPYRNRPRNPGQSFGSKHIGSATGTGNRSQQRGTGANVSTSQKSVKPVVGEEENTFVEKPKSGKGVKLGDIVTKTEFKKSGGQNSPMTYGDENLGEGPDDMEFDGPEEMEMGSPLSRRDYSDEMSQIDPDEALDMIATIKYMDSMGLSNAAKSYDEAQMAQMTPNQLRKYHSEVTGGVDEATNPTKTKTKVDPFGMDDMDDILNPRQADLPAVINDPEDDGEISGQSPMSLPTASRNTTQDRLRGMTPSETMRDYMSRINQTVGADEPNMPDTPENELVVRTANDVPAVISNALQAAGVANPEWHLIRNLPGMNERNIRAINRGIFGMMTNTPGEQIRTIANVDGQGPNTDAEINAVASFLQNNAEDLGEVTVGHGEAIPGYAPKAHNYRANGVLFHVVSDPMGKYIYTWPDSDTKQIGGGQGQGQQGQLPGGRGNMPRLREFDEELMLKPSLFERIRWDEEIKAVFESLDKEIIEESTLSRLLGKKKGGQQLVRFLHRKHKLSNEAELEPVKFNKGLLWSQFKSNPDDFVIVSGQNGVAGIKPNKKAFDDYVAAKTKKGQTPNPGGNSSLPYQVIAFTDDGEQVDPELLRPSPEPGDEPEQRDPDPTVQKSRMGRNIGADLVNPDNTFRLLNDQIGPITTVWISGFAGYRSDPESVRPATGSVERDKMAKRVDIKKPGNPADSRMAFPDRKAPAKPSRTARTGNDLKDIFNRVRPVLKTLAAQAIGNINNRAKRYIEGGNFEAAAKVASSGAKLKQFLVQLDTTGDITLDSGWGSKTREFTEAIEKAVEHASGSKKGNDAYNEYMHAAATGSARELGPILDSLRQTLVGL